MSDYKCLKERRLLVRATLYSNGSFEPMRKDCHTLPPMGSSDAPAPAVKCDVIGQRALVGISGFKGLEGKQGRKLTISRC